LAGTQRDSDSFCVAVLVGSERTNSLAAGYASLARRDGRVRPAWAYSGRWRRAHGHDSSLRGAASGWAGPSLAPTRPPRPWPQPMWSCERLGWAFTRARHGRRSCVRPTQRGSCCEAPRSAGAIGGRSDRRTRRHPQAFTGWKRPRGVAAACGQGARARRFSRDTFRGSSRLGTAPCVVGFFPALGGGSWNGRHISAWARVASSRLSRKDWLRRTAQ
jgi:hypothetical protein